MFDKLEITSPKRTKSNDTFQEFYPYYAGFPEAFVTSLLRSAKCAPGSVIFDPWNGSGTTTAAATRLGLPSIGFDLNPAMVVIAKARLLQPSEAHSLVPIARSIAKNSRPKAVALDKADPLLDWFQPQTATAIRAIECSVRELLIDEQSKWAIEELSCLAATFYTSLFALSREAASKFKTSNPTWMKLPDTRQQRLQIPDIELRARFLDVVNRLSTHLQSSASPQSWRSSAQICVADATKSRAPIEVDFVISSPPYCTRIDYVAATRVELALLSGLMKLDPESLKRDMLGTTKVPLKLAEPSQNWGEECLRLLDRVRSHPSRASASYYYPTHVDYFEKAYLSIQQISAALKRGGKAFLIVQNSFYKEVHNDLPLIISQMAEKAGLQLRKRSDFASVNCMSRINSRSAAHASRNGSIESVLGFEKIH